MVPITGTEVVSVGTPSLFVRSKKGKGITGRINPGMLSASAASFAQFAAYSLLAASAPLAENAPVFVNASRSAAAEEKEPVTVRSMEPSMIPCFRVVFEKKLSRLAERSSIYMLSTSGLMAAMGSDMVLKKALPVRSTLRSFENSSNRAILIA